MAALALMTNQQNWNIQPGAISPVDFVDAASAAVGVLGSYQDSCEGGGALEFIAEISGGAAAYVFDNIPQTYRDLMLRWELESDNNGDIDSGGIVFDDNVNTDYHWQYWRILSDTGTLNGDALSSQNSVFIYHGVNGSTSTPGYLGTGEIVIRNYALGGIKPYAYNVFSRGSTTPGSYRNQQGSGWYNNANPIEKIEVFPVVGSNFVSPSSVRLYGLRSS